MSAVIINIDTALTNVPTIEVGKQGENGATQVVFDVSEMIETYGSGTAYVVVQRRGDAEPYLLDNTSQSGNKVTWTVSNVDTDVYGTGRVQLFWMINEQVAKTVTYQFYVEEALTNPTDAPVVPGGWISDEIGNLDNLTTTAKENLVAAINEVNAQVAENTEDISDLKEDFDDLDDRVTALEEGGSGSGLTDDIKQALLQIASKVAYIDDDGQDYYDDLYDALYPPVDLVSISCIYTQSGAVYTTDSLDVLKDDLVVTAHYDDSSTETITTYTLSGTLTVGTSTITVAYGGKTTTFNVTVSQALEENFVKVNSPVINNKILEKNSTNVGYIRTDEIFSPSTNSWNIKFKIKKSTGGSAYQDIVDTVDSSNAHIRSLLYEILNITIKQYLASSGSESWDIQSGTLGSADITDGAWYWLDCYYDGTNTYGIKLSTDGESWTNYSFTSSKYIAGGGYLAFGRAVNGEFNGEIDLSTLEIYIDDEIWWQAYGTPKTVTSISAVYTQSGTVYESASLDSLKSDLVVTATYDDSSTSVIASNKYTLSGTLTVGTSVVTASYGGKTATFNVTVSEQQVYTGYTEVGSPTITDNILTVGEGKFITCNQPFVPSNEPWEVICKYQRTETFGSYTDVIGSVDSTGASIRGFLLEYNNGTGTNGAMYCSSNGTSWDITTQQTVNTIPDALNTWVWASVAFTGESYVFKTSTNGSTWTTQKTISSTTPIYDETGASVGFGLKRSGWIRGKIDLTGCMIYKNGNLWWKAV